MIKNQIENIRNLRSQNYSYKSIAEILGVSINSVKSVCRRYGFTVDEALVGDVKQSVPHEVLMECKYCGKLMDNPWHRKNKSFCSDKCRYAFWNREKSLSNYWTQRTAKLIGENAGLPAHSKR